MKHTLTGTQTKVSFDLEDAPRTDIPHHYLGPGYIPTTVTITVIAQPDQGVAANTARVRGYRIKKDGTVGRQIVDTRYWVGDKDNPAFVHELAEVAVHIVTGQLS
jgi:hypothetical protein